MQVDQNMIIGLTAEVISYEEKRIDNGKNTVVFFKLQIGFSKGSKKRWWLNKRYSEFDTLDKVLRNIYSNLPSLPGKTIFKLNNEGQVE